MHFTNHFPVVSLRSTTGYCMLSLRDKKLRKAKGSTTPVFISPGLGPNLTFKKTPGITGLAR